PAEGIYPLAVNATGKDECLVGRIRQDLSSDNGIVLWTAMDNIRKGAALNAVQIAELLVTS
ncbi:aspartate-semialdehyde dehydrogenase, partial [bacterium]|nr:aspartate-semialdehyde dehydrogenase [bacterium]